MIQVELDDQGAITLCRDYAELFGDPGPLLFELGLAAREELKNHFFAKDTAEPNQLSGRRRHFWNQVARSVEDAVVDAGNATFEVPITHRAIAQKLHGGPINTVRAEWLVIPVDSESYGISPSVLEEKVDLNVFRIPLRHGGYGLATRSPKSRELRLRYILRESVEQAPTPNTLPSSDRLAEVLRDRAVSILSSPANQSKP